MRRIDVEKKRAAKWPWLVGVVALAGVAWGATVLLAPPPEPDPPSVPPTAGDTLEPAAIPASSTGDAGGVSVDDLYPLGPEDAGTRVQVTGEVLATGNDGFWILDGDVVVHVHSSRHVRKGGTVVSNGRLRRSEGEDRTDRIAEEVLSRYRGFERWTIVRSVVLEEEDTEAEEEGAHRHEGIEAVEEAVDSGDGGAGGDEGGGNPGR